jgi:superfamily II DNA or RNA helicase/energy-coupling factor transporter ATP-binding protein EcfA2
MAQKNKLKKNIVPPEELNFEKHKSVTLPWPPQSQYPLNLKKLGRRIFREIKQDIRESKSFLIVTGFTSLAQIIDFFGEHTDFSLTENVRVVIGWEPVFKERKNYRKVDLQDEVKDYWLENDYSIIAKGGGYVIRIIELIEKKNVDFRIYNDSNDRLHAKIYVGDFHAQAGSANFSETGLNSQLEFMVRVSNLGTMEEKSYFDNFKMTAESYYQLSNDYNEKLIELLKNLLSIVTWQEALSRAIHEILNRNSMYDELPELHRKINSLKLWPSQRLGLHQALMILQKNGCVLIADPTGSGKTKMITTLQMLVFNWLLETGRQFQNFSLTIAPPLVKEQWENEFDKLKKFAGNSVSSMGILSHSSGINYRKIKEHLVDANILTIDEAHNYLNNKSVRSSTISFNTADYVILSTATPINKRPNDLLRVIELLGIDNLGDEEIEEYKKLKSTRGDFHNKGKNIDMLRKFISKIIVRRTKPDIRSLISQQKEAYIDRNGNLCAYPKQNPLIYKVIETKEDVEIAMKINELAKRLRGIIYLQNLKKISNFYVEDRKYIENREKMAKNLSIYHIQAAMRSSKAALLEHLLGTKEATEFCGFDSKKTITGNIIQKSRDCKISPPKTNFSQDVLPDWLKKQNFHIYQSYCDEEIRIYEEITELAKQFSLERELSKIRKIIETSKKSPFIVAFDSIPLTLDFLKHIISKESPDIYDKVYVVTGNTSKTIVKAFGFEPTPIKLESGILLCSDVLSESIGLQKSATLFFLDMPSVLRLAEQRIGRIERLDSSYKEIDVYWPLDSNEFALKTDKKLIRTANAVENIYGANFELPMQIADRTYELENYSPQEMIEDLKDTEKRDLMWEGISDSFKPVYELFEAKKGIIDEVNYEKFARVKANIKLKISIGVSKKSWCFICLKSSKKQPPRWFLIHSRNKIETELPQICENLRSNITDVEEWVQDKITKNDWEQVRRYVQRIQMKSIEFLPNKKKRALLIAEYLLDKQLKNETDNEIRNLILENKKILQPSISKEDDLDFDFDRFSQMWLDILQPHLTELKIKSPRKIITLNNLKSDFNGRFSREVLINLLNNAPFTESIWHRVTSLIMAIPPKNEY